ncbi:MAG: hypothetical protein EZS28_052163, partial [Streblomastix strix]
RGDSFARNQTIRSLDDPVQTIIGGGYESIRWKSPEVTEGDTAGPSSSVFSLGMIIWEMWTGEVPFGEIDAITAN